MTGKVQLAQKNRAAALSVHAPSTHRELGWPEHMDKIYRSTNLAAQTGAANPQMQDS
jgi:hypothetical protein